MTVSRDDHSRKSNSDDSIRALIVGSTGQVGWELQRTAPEGVEVFAVDSSEMDIRDKNNIIEVLNSISPDIIINTAAYTDVDKAEDEPELAFSVNATGAGNLAELAYIQGARFIHISTDFVFDGMQSHPYFPDDIPNPVGVYGASKLAGERLVKKNSHEQAVIIRTSWVYSVHGDNFVKTMLKLMRERNELSVVADQVGTPTWAFNLANTIWRVGINSKYKGVLHCSDSGMASWYDFATAILDYSIELGLLEHSITIHPISSIQYKTRARRPAYSVLKNNISKLENKNYHWQHSLHLMLKELLERDEF